MSPSLEEKIRKWLNKGEGSCDARLLAHRQCLIRMLKALWERQTGEERAMRRTNRLNARGFNAHDAPRAGKMLDEIRDNDLPIKIAWKAKFLLYKYSRQLAEIKSGKN